MRKPHRTEPGICLQEGRAVRRVKQGQGGSPSRLRFLEKVSVFYLCPQGSPQLTATPSQKSFPDALRGLYTVYNQTAQNPVKGARRYGQNRYSCQDCSPADWLWVLGQDSLEGDQL
ncbi:hypothetical protein MC885_011811 [Smutsia gigantea]|nr:hypothetical protein MC885_011811 [Smutsia gigantea]